MNVLDKSAIRNCTSCQVCAASCPNDAITISLNNDGFYRPHVDESLCINCGLCVSVCYRFDGEISVTTDKDLEGKSVFSAWSCDDEIIKETTSGGIADILAHELLRRGYQVVGVVYDYGEMRAEHRIANKPEELIHFRGSKYIQSFSFHAFKDIVANCRHKRYAVFGTPCQIYALSKLAKKLKVRDNFFFVDLFCHGCPSLYLWKKYIEEINEGLGSQPYDTVRFRSKKRGWGIYCVEVEHDGKTVFLSKKAKDPFYELFFSDLLLNDSCPDCKFRGSLEYTDIRLGDFWGKEFIGNHRGVSAVCVSSEKGQDLFKGLKGIEFSQLEFKRLLPYQNWKVSYLVNEGERTTLLDSIRNSSQNMNDAVRILYQQQGIRKSIYRFGRMIMSYLPVSFEDSIKRIYYKVRSI